MLPSSAAKAILLLALALFLANPFVYARVAAVFIVLVVNLEKKFLGEGAQGAIQMDTAHID